MKHLIVGIFALLLCSLGRGSDEHAALLAAQKAEDAKIFHAEQEPLARELEAMLSDDTKLTLYSIEPNEESNWLAKGKRNGIDVFRTYPVRGFAAISDHKEIRQLLQALISSMRESDGSVANCFDPHHGLTVEHAGKKIDLVVCFGCREGRSYGAYAANGFLVTAKPLTVFNEALARHKLPLPE